MYLLQEEVLYVHILEILTSVAYFVESAIMDQRKNSVKRFVLLMLHVVCERDHLRCQSKKLEEHFSLLNYFYRGVIVIITDIMSK